MQRYRTLISLPLLAALIAGCSTNGASQLPKVTQSNLSTIGKLEFAVGVATFADGSSGLNTVATFRQSSGASATVVNTPSIVGPVGFTVPVTSSTPGPCSKSSFQSLTCLEGSGSDANGNTISGQVQGANVASTSTFGTSGGVFSAGFAPYNSTQTGQALYPSLASPPYVQPFYSEKLTLPIPALPYIGGPPAYPFVGNGLYPGGFIGWVQGFNAFVAKPVTGTYSLNLKVAASNAASASYSATANIPAGTNPLPSYGLTPPAFTSDGTGGGTVQVNVPADSRISETMVYVVDINTSNGVISFYTLVPQSGQGKTLTFSLPDDLGPCSVGGNNCQTNPSTQTPSINTGDIYAVYAASFDYPMFEIEPPAGTAGGTAQAPTWFGSGAPADLTLSLPNQGTY